MRGTQIRGLRMKGYRDEDNVKKGNKRRMSRDDQRLSPRVSSLI
jgi:hypothetical protein